MAPSTIREAEPLSQGEVGERLRRMLVGKSALDVRQLRFISMAKIAAAYGGSWSRVRTEALSSAHDIVVRSLGPKDVVACGDDGFVVISGEGGPAEAERLARALSTRMEEYFLGTPPAGASASGPAPVPEHSEGDVDFFGPDEVADDEPNALTAFDWRFQPVWDVRREMLGVWSVTAYVKGKGQPVPGYLFDTFGEQGGFVNIDEAALTVSEQVIKRLIAANEMAVIGVPLHVSTLTDAASRARILSAFEKLAPETARYRLVKIAGARPGFPRAQLDEIVTFIRALTPNLSVSSAWTEPDVASIAAAGPATMGFSLSKAAAGDGFLMPHADVLARVRAAVQVAHAARRPFIVEGMFGRVLARELVSLGVDGLASPAVWKAEAAPLPMLRWPAAKLSSSCVNRRGIRTPFSGL